MKTAYEILEENRRDTDHFADQDWYEEDIIRMMEQFASDRLVEFSKWHKECFNSSYLMSAELIVKTFLESPQPPK